MSGKRGRARRKNKIINEKKGESIALEEKYKPTRTVKEQREEKQQSCKQTKT